MLIILKTIHSTLGGETKIHYCFLTLRISLTINITLSPILKFDGLIVSELITKISFLNIKNKFNVEL